MRYAVGIDPGYVNGAICLLDEDHSTIIFHDINDSHVKNGRWHQPLIEFFRKYKGMISNIAIEKVHTSPMQGVVSAGKFMGSAMVLETLAHLTGAPYELVLPVKWQESLGVSVEREKLSEEQTPQEREKARRDNKKNLKQSVYYWAKAKFPHAELRSFTKDSNRADALGIAWYASLQKV